MKVTYTDRNDIPLTVDVTETLGGLMITATYDEDHLQPEVPLLAEDSWSVDGTTVYLHVDHIGLSDIRQHPDGRGYDMLKMVAETDFERHMIQEARMFCCNNQILMLPGEMTASSEVK